MRKFFSTFFTFFLIGASPNSLAVVDLDLRDPENIDIADIYIAHNFIRIVSFADTQGDKNSGRSFFGLSKDGGENFEDVFVASILFNKSGERNIYITTNIKCEGDGADLDDTVVKTAGQNVRYLQFCNGETIYITPRSEAGKNFLLKKFKELNNVAFEFSHLNVLFDATGFTKAWENIGGDAL